MTQNNPAIIKRALTAVQFLTPYQPGKPISDVARELGLNEIIKLASNENPLGPGYKALVAITNALEEVWRYPDGNGFALKEKLAAKHGVGTSQITLGNGSSDVLEFAVRVFADRGDEVLYSQHAFAMYPIVAHAAGAVGVEAPARDWGYDLAALRAHITDRTRVIFIANPNNPTGTWVAGDTLEAFIRDVPDDILVVVDEAYFDYARDLLGEDDYPDTVAWIARYPNLMVTRTFSKSYGLAGLRIGYAISDAGVADLLNRIRPPFNVNTFALAAAEAALEDEEHLRRSVATNREGLRQLAGGFGALGLDYIPSVGNFISVDVGEGSDEVYRQLLRAGVIVRPVANYGMPRHLRVSVGLPEQNERFLELLKKFR